MKLDLIGKVLFILAVGAVIYGLLKIFNAEEHLTSVNLPIAAIAAIMYLSSMAAWNMAWGFYLKIPSIRASKIGFASQIGGLTPLSLGADFLRGMYAKKEGKKFADGMSASLASKFQKILIALVFSSIGIGFLVLKHSELGDSLFFGIAIPILMLIGVYFLTQNYSSILISKLTLKKIKPSDTADFSKSLKEFILHPTPSIILLLLISLLAEFFSFYLCFQALGVTLDMIAAYLIFVLLFFAAKAFFVPQGLGVIEIVGLVLLSSTVPSSIVAAALLVYNVVRIWVPTTIAGIAILDMNPGIDGKV